MQNDAKLGLLVGVGLVILVAVVFFRKEPGPGGAPNALPASLGTAPAAAPRDLYRPVKANPTASVPAAAEPDGEQKHTVREGETLFSLAERYYGSKDRFIDLFQRNRDTIASPDELTPGTVLVVPAARAKEAKEPPDETP
jgi:nucleoid-associated protein YgaU